MANPQSWFRLSTCEDSIGMLKTKALHNRANAVVKGHEKTGMIRFSGKLAPPDAVYSCSPGVIVQAPIDILAIATNRHPENHSCYAGKNYTRPAGDVEAGITFNRS